MKTSVLGDIGVDYYENLKILKPGGIAFNFAFHLKKSGVEHVTLMSIIGKDIYAKKLINVLKKTKIDTSWIQKASGDTPMQNISLANGERKFTGYNPGVLKKWKLRKKDLYSLASHDALFVPLSDGMKHIFDEVKKLTGPIKAVDFSQDSEYADFDKKENVITKNSKYFDVVFVGGKKKHENIIAKLSKEYPQKVFVLTLGKLGSLAYYMNKKYIHSAQRVKIVDTTGAGDSFQAAFFATWIKTKDVKKSLHIATKNSSKVINHLGSTNLILE